MGKRLASLEARMAELEDRGAQAKTAATTARLHTNLPELYARKVRELDRLIADEAHKAETMMLIRSLTERVVLTPEGDEFVVVLHGDLARILAICGAAGSDVAAAADGTFGPNRRGPAPYDASPQLSVGAGIGFEPMTFRL